MRIVTSRRRYSFVARPGGAGPRRGIAPRFPWMVSLVDGGPLVRVTDGVDADNVQMCVLLGVARVAVAGALLAERCVVLVVCVASRGDSGGAG